MMKGTKGFTLVELAIVIVVIGILAAIAIPRFLTMQQAAGKAALDSNYDALRTAVLSAKTRTGIFPSASDFDAGAVRDPVTGRVVAYFFSSPTTRYDDRTYSNLMIVDDTAKIEEGAELVGSDRNCPSGYEKFYLVNTVRGTRGGKVVADVYGAICYNPSLGDIKKQW